ncbi:MAG: hypothetical protein QF535_20705, partial [Anaerolineales bacterium]|nr:hypothetical protein [Anaerolineales bacterium]
MSILQSGATKSLAASYDIDNSLRFYDDAYLSRTVGTPTSARIGTLSWWQKLGDQTDVTMGFANYTDADNRTSIATTTSSMVLQMYGKVGGTAMKPNIVTTQVFRDPSAWYHMVVTVDVSQSTAADRVKFYVNGDQITSFTTTDYPDQNVDLPLFSSPNMIIGRRYNGSFVDYTDGYMAEFYYVDGTALTPSSFGETSSTTNQWIPLDSDDVKDAVTFGTNGFYQKYGSTELADSFADSADRSVHTMTVGGNTHTDTTTKKIGTASAEFDGTGDYLYVDGSNTTDTNSDFVFTGDFTVEGWVYPSSSGSGEDYLIAHWKSGAYTSGWAVQYTHSTNKFGAWVNFNTSGTDQESLTQSGTSAEDAWYHVALTRSGDVYTLWVDG